MRVVFNTHDDVEDFVASCSAIDADVDVRKGKLSVDGKSIMGLLGFGFGTALDAKVLTDNIEILKQFMSVASKYAC